MAYEYFAKYYDKMMSDIPYEQYKKLIKQYAGKNDIILDMACGSGKLAIDLKKDGYDISGADVSNEMLTIAREKANEIGVFVDFYEQDMLEPLQGNQIDMITTFVDSINYLLTLEDVESYFKEVYRALKDGGYFLFDVHSLYKINHIYNDNLFVDLDFDVSYVWTTELDEIPNQIIHELTIFAKNNDGTYNRYDEIHYQRTFSIKEYGDLLQQIGFSFKVLYDFDSNKTETPDKIIFICQKK